MKEQLISIVISLFLIIVGAIISTYYPEHLKLIDSIYIGTFSYIISLITFMSSKINVLEHFHDLHSEVKNIATFLHAQEKAIRKGDDSFDIFWAISMLKAKEGIYKLVDSNTFEVSKNQIPKFWEQAIINTDYSWLCTNYIELEDQWNRGWAKRGLEFHKLGIEEIGLGVKRVFIFDNIKEAQSKYSIDIMRKHEECGIKVKWVTRDFSLKWASLDNFVKLIGTFDIAIINGCYLFSFLLNDTRGLELLRCTSDIKIIKEINVLYNRLWDESDSIDKLLSENN